MSSGITETLELNLTYDVILMHAGDNHIAMIAALQTVRDLDVAEADRLLGVLPRTVLECTPWTDARHARRTLEQAGAQVQLRLCE